MPLSTSEFSIFLQDVPRKDEIVEIIDRLQSETVINPNLLLYGLWVAVSERGRLRRPEFKKLQAALHPWHDRIVISLIHLAESIKTWRPLQTLVKNELRIAVQYERQMLSQVLNFPKRIKRNLEQQLSDACHNMIIYYKIMKVHIDESTKNNLQQLLQIFFNEFESPQIAQYLNQAINAAKLEELALIQLHLV